MSSKDCSSWKAGIRASTASTSTPCSSNSSSTMWTEGKKKEKRPAARKLKRTSFACLVCSKAFPSQQAMAGHCSTHSRAGARRIPTRHSKQLPASPVVAGPSHPPPRQQRPNDARVARHYWWQQVQGSSTNHNYEPPVATRYAPYAPCVRPISNQMTVRLPYLELNGRSSVSPAPMDITMHPSCSTKGDAPSDVCSTTNQPGHTRVDLTLRLGSDGNHAQKRTLPLVESLMVPSGHQADRRQGKRALVMDGGDEGCNKGKDLMNGLDLELRL